MLNLEDFVALPIEAQIGFIAFGIVIVLLVVTQALSLAAGRSREQMARFEALRSEVRALLYTIDSNDGRARYFVGGQLNQRPRPVRRTQIVRKNVPRLSRKTIRTGK